MTSITNISNHIDKIINDKSIDNTNNKFNKLINGLGISWYYLHDNLDGWNFLIRIHNYNLDTLKSLTIGFKSNKDEPELEEVLYCIASDIEMYLNGTLDDIYSDDVEKLKRIKRMIRRQIKKLPNIINIPIDEFIDTLKLLE